ncbi:hypothetical protein ACHAW5_008353 [Stephanodiscus triporus]|uniref:TFIIS-type domain-containing protein n=1 Tax=Stephanodiscus triporus TaxID=2934178 RepID=A0ABD3NPF4_9STRA
MSIEAFQGFPRDADPEETLESAAAGLFGDDDDDDGDVLGLDDGDGFDRRRAGDVDQERGLLMRFCPHDSSMLYPKRQLTYACRLCRYAERSAGSLVYRNVLKKEVGNVLHTVPSAVSDDPTLPRSQNAYCGKCGHNEGVFFQNDTSDAKNDTLVLIFVCCNCDYKWLVACRARAGGGGGDANLFGTTRVE